MNDAAPNAPRIVWWRALLALTVTGLVVGLLLWEVGGLEASRVTLTDARWSLAPLPLVLMGLILALCVRKWMVVLEAMGHPIAFRQGVYALLASMPIAAITPSRAGDFLRAKVIEAQVPVVKALGSVVCDRLVDIQNLVVLAIVGACLTAHTQVAAWLAAGLALAWVLLLLALKFREPLLASGPIARVAEPVGELLAATLAMLTQPRAFARQMAYSLANWVTVLTVLYSLGLVFDAGLTWLEVLALWPLATLFGLIPLTLSGMGTRDAAFVYLVANFGHEAPNESAIVTATLVYAFISSWMWGVIGLPFTWRWLTRTEGPQG